MAKFKKAKKAQPETAIYVGPNLGGETPVSQFTVFKNGFPPHIAERMGADPNFKALFVPIDGLNAARADLKKPASHKARAFTAIVKKRGNK
jgi:hypothetical protein